MFSLSPHLGDLSAEAAPGAQVSRWEEGPAPPLCPASPEGTAGNGGQKCCNFIVNPLYRKNPIYVQTLCGPALAQLVGGDTGEQGAWQLVWGSGSGREEGSRHGRGSAPPLISASSSPAPLGQGGPRSLSPRRDSIDQRSCPSVCPADYLPSAPACPRPLPQSGFFGVSLSNLNPFILD